MVGIIICHMKKMFLSKAVKMAFLFKVPILPVGIH